jgi:hypothetical protein
VVRALSDPRHPANAEAGAAGAAGATRSCWLESLVLHFAFLLRDRLSEVARLPCWLIRLPCPSTRVPPLRVPSPPVRAAQRRGTRGPCQVPRDGAALLPTIFGLASYGPASGLPGAAAGDPFLERVACACAAAAARVPPGAPTGGALAWWPPHDVAACVRARELWRGDAAAAARALASRAGAWPLPGVGGADGAGAAGEEEERAVCGVAASLMAAAEDRAHGAALLLKARGAPHAAHPARAARGRDETCPFSTGEGRDVSV